MPDIADSEDIADDAVTIAVNGIYILLNIILYHGTLQLRPLVSIEAHIIGILVIIQSRHIKLSGGTAGGLTVKPYQRFLLICHSSSVSRRCFFRRSR